MSLPRYPAYKDSGAEGFGKIPAHWHVTALKWLVSMRSGDAITAESIQDVGEFSVFGGNGLRGFTSAYTHDGDFVLIGRQGALCGNINYASGKFWASEHAVVVTPVRQIDNVWFGELLRVMNLNQYSVAAAQPGLSVDAVSKLEIPVPPPVEQRGIGRFLRREIAKIDALVAEQQRLIELLKEKRQALISHAVTKGLNPNAPMKPSGVEWLGDVPAHWAVVPFAYAIRFQEGPGIMAADFCESGVPLVRVSGVQGRWASLEGCNYLDPKKVGNRWEHFRLNVGDLLISASASMGTVCEVGPEAQGAVPYTGLIRLMAHEQIILRDFIRAIVSSSLFMTQIDLLKAGATIQHFGPTHLRQMKVVLPPKDEQEMLVGYIERHSDLFNKLVAEAQSAIELLQERRLALISAAVTGQIDVRGLARQEAA